MRPIAAIVPGLEARAWEYADLPKEPFFVSCTLETPYVRGFDGPAVPLDTRLALGLKLSLPVEPEFPPEGLIFPLPIELIWQSPEGLPLWATSDLRPVGKFHPFIEYTHKRHPRDRVWLCERPNAQTSTGRWAERRTAIPLIATKSLAALAIGHRETAMDLIRRLTHVSKAASIGRGLVRHWQVETMLNMSLEEAKAIILRSRPVPIGALSEMPSIPDGAAIAPRGWTPPVWKTDWHHPCLLPPDWQEVDR